jgi:hypothetical protein
MPAKDKHSSLFQMFINYGQKSFITLAPDVVPKYDVKDGLRSEWLGFDIAEDDGVDDVGQDGGGDVDGEPKIFQRCHFHKL